MQAITLIPHNEQQMRLIKLLAKTLDIKATVVKKPQKKNEEETRASR